MLWFSVSSGTIFQIGTMLKHTERYFTAGLVQQCSVRTYKFQALISRLSSRSQIFFKTGVLKNFANFTGKHLCWSLFLKVADHRTPPVAASGASKPCTNTLRNMFKDQFVLLTLLAVIALNFSHRTSNLLKSIAVYQIKSKILATLRTIGLVWKHQIS